MLTVGENSYVDVSDATDYYADRLDSDEWTNFPNQEQALITATTLLDSLCTWSGEKTDPNQHLEFPRNGDTEVPKDIITSQLEIALEMIKQGSSSFVESSEALSKLKAGSVTLEWYEKEFIIPVINSLVKSLLSKYGSCFFGGNSVIVTSVTR